MNANEIQSEVAKSIAQSQSHSIITCIEAANRDEAKMIIAEAKGKAEESNYFFDWTDTNNGYDCWAGNGESGKMEWRIEIHI